MKKLFIAAVSALGLFALAACEGGEAPPQDGGGMDGGGMDGGAMDGTGTGTADPAQ